MTVVHMSDKDLELFMGGKKFNYWVSMCRPTGFAGRQITIIALAY
jgi:hypothetical protein